MQHHLPDYKSMCRLEFGAYCEVHDDPHPSNTMVPRTTSAIALYPANNQQGGYLFMNLATGKLLSRYQWTKLLIPDSVIRAVNERGKTDRKIKEGDTIPEMFEFSIRNKEVVISPISDSNDKVPSDFHASDEPSLTLEVDAIIHPDIDEQPQP